MFSLPALYSLVCIVEWALAAISSMTKVEKVVKFRRKTQKEGDLLATSSPCIR